MLFGYPWQIPHFARISLKKCRNGRSVCFLWQCSSERKNQLFVDRVEVFPIINKYLRVFCLTAKAVPRLNSQSDEI